MTHVSRKRGRKTRARWLPFLTVAILALHGVVLFLLLSQGSKKLPRVRTETFFIQVDDLKHPQKSLEFREPPERMFYRFASVPIGEKELVPIGGRRWNGYETLVALEARDFSPIESYRLTLEYVEDGERSKRPLQVRSRVETRIVGVVATSTQSVIPVPEPGALTLLGVVGIGFILRRSR